MKKITHYFKKNIGIKLSIIVVVFLAPIAIYAAGTTIKFTPVTVTRTGAGAATATTNITYVDTTKTNTTPVVGVSIDAVLYTKGFLGINDERARTNITNVVAKYNVPATAAAKFTGLDEKKEYWITFNEKSAPNTVVKSANFKLEDKILKFGGGKFGGAGATGTWTEGTTIPPTTPTVPTIPTDPKPTTPKPPNVAPEAEPVAPTTYELEFRFLPDAWLQTLKAKGSVKYTSSNGSKGVLAGTITLTPIAYNGDRLTAETFTLPNINVESGNTYPLEFSFKQTIPLGVSISKVELGSLDDTSIYPASGTLTGPSTNVITGADGKIAATFSVSKADYDAAKKTINIVGNITYPNDFITTDKYNKILVDIYSDEVKVSTKNIIFTKNPTAYALDFNSVITDVDPAKIPTTFKLRDSSVNVTSNLFPIKAGATQNTGNGTVTTTTVSGVTRFSGTSTASSVVKVNGDVTPTVSGNNLNIKGEVTYTCGIQTKIDQNSVISLADKTGVIYQSIPTKINGSTIGTADCGIPLHFDINFSDYKKIVGSDGKVTDPITPKEAPLTIQFVDKANKIESNKIVVISSITTTNNTTNNNPGSPTAPPQTSSLTIPSGEFKGKKVDILITSSMLVASADTDARFAKALPDLFIHYAEAQTSTQSSIVVNGSVKYNDFGDFATANVDKIGKIKFVLKGKNGVISTQDSLDIVNQSGMGLSAAIPFTTTFNSVDKSQGPFTVEITEKDLGVTSTAFRVAEPGNPAGDTNGDGVVDKNDTGDTNGDGVIDDKDVAAPKASLQRISLGNPLKDGLDSIPEIVAVLVKDIVIPIAIPFLALSIIYTGFLFVQARGNADKLKEAKAALKWTLIGGTIILGAYVIATALQSTIADIVK